MEFDLDALPEITTEEKPTEQKVDLDSLPEVGEDAVDLDSLPEVGEDAVDLDSLPEVGDDGTPVEPPKKSLGIVGTLKAQTDAKAGREVGAVEAIAENIPVVGQIMDAEYNRQWNNLRRLYEGDFQSDLEARILAKQVGISEDDMQRITEEAGYGHKNLMGNWSKFDLEKGKALYKELVAPEFAKRLQVREQAQQQLNENDLNWVQKGVVGGVGATKLVGSMANAPVAAATLGIDATNRAAQLLEDKWVLDENGQPTKIWWRTDKDGNPVRDEAGNLVPREEVSQDMAVLKGITGAATERFIWMGLGKATKWLGAKAIGKMERTAAGAKVSEALAKAASGTMKGVQEATQWLEQSAAGRSVLNIGKAIGWLNSKGKFGSIPDMMLKSRIQEFADEVVGLNVADPAEREKFTDWLGKFVSVKENAELFTEMLAMHLVMKTGGLSLNMSGRAMEKIGLRPEAAARRAAVGRMRDDLAELIGEERAKELKDGDVVNLYRLVTSKGFTAERAEQFAEKIAGDVDEAQKLIDEGASLSSLAEGLKTRRQYSDQFVEGAKAAAAELRDRVTLDGAQSAKVNDAALKAAEGNVEIAAKVAALAKSRLTNKHTQVDDAEGLETLVAEAMRPFAPEARAVKIHDMRGNRNVGEQLTALEELGIGSVEAAELNGVVRRDENGHLTGGARQAVNIAAHGTEALKGAVKDGSIDAATAEALITASHTELGAATPEERAAFIDGILERAKGDAALARKMVELAGEGEGLTQRRGEAESAEFLDALAERAKASIELEEAIPDKLKDIVGCRLMSIEGGVLGCSRFRGMTAEFGESTDENGNVSKKLSVKGLGEGQLAKPGNWADGAVLVAELQRVAEKNGAVLDFGSVEANTEAAGLLNKVKTEGIEKAKARLETRAKLFDVLARSALDTGVTFDEASFRKALADSPNGRRFMDNHGNIYGLQSPDGTLHFNPLQLDYNIPIHEYGHLALESLKLVNRRLWERGMELVKGSDYYRSIRDQAETEGHEYSYLKGDEAGICDEALATMIGDNGERLIEAKGVGAELKAWLKDFWKAFKGAFGLADMTDAQIEKMTLGEFVDAVNAELLRGKEFGTRKQVPLKEKSIRRYDEAEGSGSNGMLRWKNDRGRLFYIPVDKERTRPGGKVFLATDDADVTDWIQSRLNGVELRMSESGSIYVKGRSGFEGELAEIFGRYPKAGQNDGIFEQLATDLQNESLRQITPDDLVGMLAKDRANYDEWVKTTRDGKTSLEDVRMDEHYRELVEEEEAEARRRWESSGMDLPEYILSRIEEGEPGFDLDWETMREIDHDVAMGRFAVGGRVAASNMGIKGAADAEAMEKTGADREKIWRETGWWKGKDGKWRFELPRMRRGAWHGDPEERHFTGGGDDFYRYRLTELVKNDDFFKAYPQAKKITVEFHKGMPTNVGGNFNEATLTIKLPQKYQVITDYAKYGLGEGKAAGLNAAGAKTIEHELQHAVQLFESFAKGGSPSDPVRPYALDGNTGHALSVFAEANGMDVTNDRHLAIIASNAQKIASDQTRGEMPKRLVEAFEAAAKEAGKTPAEFSDEINRLYDSHTDSPMGQYFKLAGEVEARNAQFRANMTPEERAATPPWETEDVPESRQIVRFAVAKSVTGSDGSETYKVESNGKTKRYKTPMEALEDFIKELDGQALNEEQQGIYDVVTGDKKTTDIRKNDLGELIKLHKGGRGKGAYKILSVHYAGKRGKVTAKEVINMGLVIRNGNLILDGTEEHPNARRYEATADDGARLRLIVDFDKQGNEAVINLYSDRKGGNPGHKASSGVETTSSSPQSIPNSDAGAQGGAAKLAAGGQVVGDWVVGPNGIARRGTPQAALIGGARVADDAGRGEQTPGTLAASRELSEQPRSRIQEVGRVRVTSFPISEIFRMHKELSGNPMPVHVSKRVRGGKVSASSKDGQIYIASDVIGLVDRTDIPPLKEKLGQRGFFRNENETWAKNHSDFEVRQERERSEAQLGDELRKLADRRASGKELGGQSAERLVYMNEFAKYVMNMPRKSGSLVGDVQTVGDAVRGALNAQLAASGDKRAVQEKKMRNEAKSLLAWSGWRVEDATEADMKNLTDTMFGAWLAIPDEMERLAPTWYDAILETVTTTPSAAKAYRAAADRVYNSPQAYKHVLAEIQRSQSAAVQAMRDKLDAAAKAPITARSLTRRFAEGLVLGYHDRMGLTWMRFDEETKMKLRARKAALAELKRKGATKAELKAAAEEIDLFTGRIHQTKQKLELSRTAMERGIQNESVRYVILNRLLADKAAKKWGLTVADWKLYLDQMWVIDSQGRSGERGESARQARLILGDMARRLGAEKWARMEEFGREWFSIRERELLNDPRLERLVGKRVVDYWRSNAHYVTTKRVQSPEEMEAIERIREKMRKDGINGGDDVCGEMYTYLGSGHGGREMLGEKLWKSRLVGSFADKADSVVATTEKDMKIQQAARVNQYIIDLRDALLFAEVPGVRDMPYGEADVKQGSRYGFITYFDYGEKRTLIVPREIADGFKFDPDAFQWTAYLHRFARAVMIDYNPGYILTNEKRNIGSMERNFPGMYESWAKSLARSAFPGAATKMDLMLEHAARRSAKADRILDKVFFGITRFGHINPAERAVKFIIDPEGWQEQFWKAEARGDEDAMRGLIEDKDFAMQALRANMFTTLGKAYGDDVPLDTLHKIGKAIDNTPVARQVKKAADWLPRQNEFEDMLAKTVAFHFDRARWGKSHNRTVEESGLVVKQNVSIPETERRGRSTKGVQAFFNQFFNPKEKGTVRHVKALIERPKETLTKDGVFLATRMIGTMFATGTIAAFIRWLYGDDEKKAEASSLGEVYRFAKFMRDASQNINDYARMRHENVPVWLSPDGYTTITLHAALNDEDSLLAPTADFVARSISARMGLNPPPELGQTVVDTLWRGIAPDLEAATPVVKTLRDTLLALATNPIDGFTGKPVYDPVLYAVRYESWATRVDFATAMAKRVWDDWGLGSVYKFDRYGKESSDYGSASKWLGLALNDIPFASSAMRRFVQIHVREPGGGSGVDAAISAEDRRRANLRTYLSDKLLKKSEKMGGELNRLDPGQYKELLEGWQETYGLSAHDMRLLEKRFLNKWSERENREWVRNKKRKQLLKKAQRIGIEESERRMIRGDL